MAGFMILFTKFWCIHAFDDKLHVGCIQLSVPIVISMFIATVCFCIFALDLTSPPVPYSPLINNLQAFIQELDFKCKQYHSTSEIYY